MTPKERAEAFAKHWYSRLPSGCDEATLAAMLEREFDNAYHAGAADMQEGIIDRIADTIRRVIP